MPNDPATARTTPPPGPAEPVTLFLCGDVMTGRGIDQILRRPSDPRLHEAYVGSARTYVEIAERAHGPIPRAVDPAYVWGDALAELERRRPAARIVNLETAVTTSEDAWPGKGIHYRMHPANVAVLTAAGIDCCVLANNHVLDWGHRGLAETMASLRAAGVRSTGAGTDRSQAEAPAVLETPRGARVLVFACATTDSGVARDWAARDTRPGVALLDDVSERAAEALLRRVQTQARARDVVVVSVHWGGNWGYRVGHAERAFAQRLVDSGAVHVVHGHSSHHPRGVEVRHGRLILYGCGDFLNDYEGISGHESYRGELTLMYFPSFDPAGGRLERLVLVPMRIRRFRLERAAEADARWLERTLDRESEPFGTRFARSAAGDLELASSPS